MTRIYFRKYVFSMSFSGIQVNISLKRPETYMKKYITGLFKAARSLTIIVTKPKNVVILTKYLIKVPMLIEINSKRKFKHH